MLDSVEQIRERSARASRGHALLQLAYAVLISAYMAVFVYTGSIEAGSSALGGTTMTLILPPLIVSSGLISGANERFGGRLIMRRRQLIAVGVFLALLIVLLFWGIAGSGYPWWIAIVAFGGTLVLFSRGPIGVLRRAPAAASEPGHPATLSRPVRITTVVLGCYLGAATAVVMLPAAAWAITIVGMMAAIVALMAQTAQWGLLNTGFQWRRLQWASFFLAALAMFMLAVLIIATDLITPAIAVSAGVLIAVCLSVSALLPGRSRGASAA